jgi:hypothetical protein
LRRHAPKLGSKYRTYVSEFDAEFKITLTQESRGYFDGTHPENLVPLSPSVPSLKDVTYKLICEVPFDFNQPSSSHWFTHKSARNKTVRF